MTYDRDDTAQSDEWDRNLVPGGPNAMSEAKFEEGLRLGIATRLKPDRILRPDWTKLNADVKTLHVDHIIELQLLPASMRGDDFGNNFDNYELLDERSNTSAGSTIKSNVRAERRRLCVQSCEPRWLTCRLRFDELVPTPGFWTGARWSRAEIGRGEQVDAWRRLTLGTP